MSNVDIAKIGALGNRQGRPKGSVSRVTQEARNFAARVICDPEYRANVLERARSGTLGAFEQVLWAYAAGKPPDHVTVRVERAEQDDLATLSNVELAARAKLLAEACALLPASPTALPVIDVEASRPSEVQSEPPQSEPPAALTAKREAKRPVRSDANMREELVRLLLVEASARATVEAWAAQDSEQGSEQVGKGAR